MYIIDPLPFLRSHVFNHGPGPSTLHFNKDQLSPALHYPSFSSSSPSSSTYLPPPSPHASYAHHRCLRESTDQLASESTKDLKGYGGGWVGRNQYDKEYYLGRVLIGRYRWWGGNCILPDGL
eukprot:756999-Hanusia_phi.AAC.3